MCDVTRKHDYKHHELCDVLMWPSADRWFKAAIGGDTQGYTGCYVIYFNHLSHRNSTYCCNGWQVNVIPSLLLGIAAAVMFLHAIAATAIAHLSHHNSVCLSVTRVDQSKTVQARITKSSSLAAWKTLVSGSVNSKGVTSNDCAKWEGVGICDSQPIRRWLSKIGGTALWWVQVKHYRYLAPVVWCSLATDFVLLGFFETVAKSRMDEINRWSLRITNVQRCTAVAHSPLR